MWALFSGLCTTTRATRCMQQHILSVIPGSHVTSSVNLRHCDMTSSCHAASGCRNVESIFSLQTAGHRAWTCIQDGQAKDSRGSNGRHGLAAEVPHTWQQLAMHSGSAPARTWGEGAGVHLEEGAQVLQEVAPGPPGVPLGQLQHAAISADSLCLVQFDLDVHLGTESGSFCCSLHTPHVSPSLLPSSPPFTIIDYPLQWVC